MRGWDYLFSKRLILLKVNICDLHWFSGILEISAQIVTFSSNNITIPEEEPVGTVVARTFTNFSATEFEIIGGNSNFSIENGERLFM